MQSSFLRIIATLLPLLLLFSATAFGSESGSQIFNPAAKVSVDDMDLVSGVGITPKNELTFSLREILKTLGYEAQWHNPDRSITLTQDEEKIVLYVDALIALKNGLEVELASPVFLEGNISYLPQSVLEKLFAVFVTDLKQEEYPASKVLEVTLSSSQINLVEVREYIESLVATDAFSGTVLIGKDSEVIFKEAFGYADREEDVPMAVDTKLNLGSINKSFTALAICQLEQAGLLSYEDILETYLPEFAEVSQGKITLRNLLNHTSGLGNFFAAEGYEENQDSLNTLTDYLPYIVKPLLFEAGTKYSYSNSGYIALGLIIEKLTGKSYYDYIEEYIFAPAGMINSGYYGKAESVDNLATGYITGAGGMMPPIEPKPAPRPNTETLPARGSAAGGGYSTIEDMFSYVTALKNDSLIKNTFQEIILEATSSVPGGTDYGFGMGVFRTNGFAPVGHNGGAPGINAHYETFLDNGYTIIVLANVDNGVNAVLQNIRSRIAPKTAIAHGLASQIFINEKPLASKQQVTILDETVYLPIEDIVRELGCRLRMMNGKFTAVKDNLEVSYTEGDSQIEVNGQKRDLTAALIKIEGNLLCPMDFFSEAFGYDVSYVEGKVRIVI